MLKAKIIVVDWYYGPVLGDLDITWPSSNNSYRRVPILRVFGCLPSGQKCCIHVHGVFPYLLIHWPTDDPVAGQNFGTALNGLLTQQQQPGDGDATTSEPNKRAGQTIKMPSVLRTTVVTGYPLYGFSPTKQKYLKIEFLAAWCLKKAASLLSSGAIGGKVFQPHEIHISYTLQFMIDYNLFGMSWMEIKKFRVRPGCAEFDNSTGTTVMSNSNAKQSTCAIEGDILADEIVNRIAADGASGVVTSLTALWDDERSRRRAYGLSADVCRTLFEGGDRNVPLNEREQALLQRFSSSLTTLAEKFNVMPVVFQPPDSADNAELTQILDLLITSQQVELSNIEAVSEEEPDFSAKDDELVMPNPEAGSILAASNCSGGDFGGQDEDEEVVPVENYDDNILQLSEDSSESESIGDNDEFDLAQLDGQFDKPGPSNSQQHKRPSTISATMALPPSDEKPITLSSESNESCIELYRESVDRGCSLGSREDTAQGVGRSSSSVKRRKQECDDWNTLSVIVPASPSECSVHFSTPSSFHAFGDGMVPSPTSPTAEVAATTKLTLTTATPIPSTSHQSRRLSSQLRTSAAGQTSLNCFQDDFYTPKVAEAGATMAATYLSCSSDSNSVIVVEGKRSETSTSETPGCGGRQCFYPIEQPPSRVEVLKSIEGLLDKPSCNVEPQEAKQSQQQQQLVSTSTPHANKKSSNPHPPYPTLEISGLDIATDNHRFAVDSIVVPSAQVRMASASQDFPAKHLTVFSLELQTVTASTIPDPASDPLGIAVYSILTVSDLNEENDAIDTVVVLRTDLSLEPRFPGLPSCTALGQLSIVKVDSEKELIELVLTAIEKVDPDILVGYCIERSSFGYVLDRASRIGLEPSIVINRLGRIKQQWMKKQPQGGNKTSQDSTLLGKSSTELQVKGRIVLSLWRLIRHELSSAHSYSFESAAFHVLHKRLPAFSASTLWQWLLVSKMAHRTLLYWIERAIGNIRILQRLHLLTRTAELAALFGILFYEVFSRGSQFRVESVLLRLARRRGFIAVSPSMEQRASQAAVECIPLTLEPISNYYKNPVIVLDFQSLYPSIMIAYNYCFTTCLGRLDQLINIDSAKFGCFAANWFGIAGLGEYLARQNLTRDDVNISPNGVVFVKPLVRRGVLPAIVQELLESRLMVKASLKLYKKDYPSIAKMLDDRQLGLKLLANVTYGYTAANFSGRMPCIEVADSIVRKGRETLERAIQLVGAKSQAAYMGARVIYGDTDSMFVVVPGATVAQAFDVGELIAADVGASNPHPIKLKLEKVYSRCVLESKKRYAGAKLETKGQVDTEFEAKGIEVIRRDACPFVASVLENSLKALFATDNTSGQVSRYLARQIELLRDGRIGVEQLVLSREYRGAKGYAAVSAPAFVMANRRRAENARLEPLAGDRVAYVITEDPAAATLMSAAREPSYFLRRDAVLRPNADYYISRQLLPALDRAFAVAGIEVAQLYASENDTGKQDRRQRQKKVNSWTMTQMFAQHTCPYCGEFFTLENNWHQRAIPIKRQSKLCPQCKDNLPSNTIAAFQAGRISAQQRRLDALNRVCTSCCGFNPSIIDSGDNNHGNSCRSIDCPLRFDQAVAQCELLHLSDSEQQQQQLGAIIEGMF